MKYRGVVEASSGLLLGGVRRHVSSQFDTKAEAQAWIEAILEGNRNNKVGRSYVMSRSTTRRKKRKVTRLRRNPKTRLRRPAQKRRRSGFPGYIVTFIRPNAFYHKRQYIGGASRRFTVVYKRNQAAVFSTSDKAKNAVRNNRKWFELNRIKQVTILQTNEDAGKFE